MRARHRPRPRCRNKDPSENHEASGGLKLAVTDKKHFGASLLHATGSAEHVEQLRKLRERQGLRAQSPTAFIAAGSSSLRRRRKIFTRRWVFSSLSRNCAKAGTNRRKPQSTACQSLFCDKDLRGILHCHTTASDGTETLETMAEATRKRGFEYFGVADHSQSAHYAGGLSLDEIAEQHREADRLNKRYGKSFRILKGIEADILADGSLDYPDRVLGNFRFRRRERS